MSHILPEIKKQKTKKKEKTDKEIVKEIEEIAKKNTTRLQLAADVYKELAITQCAISQSKPEKEKEIHSMHPIYL